MRVVDKSALLQVPTCTVRLTSGAEACIKALTIDEFDMVQTKRRATDDANAGVEFAMWALRYALVHPETHAPLLDDADVETLRQSLSARDVETLMRAVNGLNGFDQEDTADPVKKPENGLASSTGSSTASPAA